MSINRVPVMNIKKKPGATGHKNKTNWLLYLLFSRHVLIYDLQVEVIGICKLR